MLKYINKNKLYIILIMPLLTSFHQLMRVWNTTDRGHESSIPVICSDIEIFKEIGNNSVFILKNKIIMIFIIN